MIIYLEMIEVDYMKYRRLYPIHKDDNTGAYYIDTLDEYFMELSEGLPYVLLQFVIKTKDKKQWYKV
jgi:hypothetical protein